MFENKNELKGANNENATALICPKCGARKLFRERLPDGRIEVMCLELDCNYTEIVETTEPTVGPESDSFAGRVGRMNEAPLRQCEEKLEESIRSLTGRAKRLAVQQLALVRAELERRKNKPQLNAEGELSDKKKSPLSSTVPPQFNTPQAVAKRIEGIRNYHRRQKGRRSPTEMTGLMNSTRWLDRLLKTLADEAYRHEQAAKNYARVPELFPLHIEHSARAFELNRVRDLLENYVEILCSENESEEMEK